MDSKRGAQLPVWNTIKTELTGSLAKFDELAEAADTTGNYYILDV